MKKFFAFALVASMMTLAACSGNKSAEGTVDSAAAVIDSSASAITDSASAVVDSAATMATDTTKK